MKSRFDIEACFIIAAEQFLESVEGNQNYGLLLLTLLDRDGVEPHIRVSAAVTFKNFIKRNWRVVCIESCFTSLLVKCLRSTSLLKLRKREADRKPFASKDACFGSCNICFSLFHIYDTIQQWVIFTESVSFCIIFCCCLKADTDKIHDNDRNTIKQQIVGLMLKSPEQIQKQVSRFKFLN